jgi:hypothetical protein
VKTETAGLKERLHLYGVSALVAHEDIRPTKDWQDEIESALEGTSFATPVVKLDPTRPRGARA